MDLSTYLEGLLQKTCIPKTELAHFLSEMRKTPSGPVITSKLLAGKIQAGSEIQALRAIDFLEAALDVEVDGSIEFRTEVGRFRFLNELIRILSPKFYGSQTPQVVKERAIKFLTDAAGSKRRQWFPSEHAKIDAVYNSLVEGGVILPNAVDPDVEFQKSIFERGENAILLKKLLQSKDPMDLQAANRLIKNLVEEEAKRNERRSEIHSLIDRIETSTTLLVEMCSQSHIDREIVDELASSCRALRNRLAVIGTETNEEISSFLMASENIEKALNFYEDRKSQDFTPAKAASEGLIEHPSLEVPIQPAAHMSLADELLIGLDLGPVVGQSSSKKNGSSDVTKVVKVKDTPNLLNFDMDLFPPQPAPPKLENMTENKSSDTLEQIDIMSRQLMQQNLNGRVSFSARLGSSDKITLNQLQKQTSAHPIPLVHDNVTPHGAVGADATQSTSHISLLDLDYLEKTSVVMDSKVPSSEPVKENQLSEDDNLLVVQKRSKATTNQNGTPNSLPLERYQFSIDAIDDIDLETIDLLETISPVTIPLDSISNNGDGNGLVELSFTFGTFPEAPGSVKVTIITLTNRNPVDSLSDYSFQLLPPKGFQVKLFPPSSTELSPWKKRFFSPPLLTQVALLRIPEAKSSGKSVKLKFILSYYLGEETALFNSEFLVPL